MNGLSCCRRIASMTGRKNPNSKCAAPVVKIQSSPDLRSEHNKGFGQALLYDADLFRNIILHVRHPLSVWCVISDHMIGVPGGSRASITSCAAFNAAASASLRVEK